MKTKEFYDQRQAHAYLSEGVVLFNESPVYIQEVVPSQEGYIAFFYPLGQVETKKRTHAFLKEKGWDFNPVPLGIISPLDGPYKKCMYASRAPQRAWKIGLTTRNLVLSSIATKDRETADRSAVLFSKNMLNTILNKYPTYRDANRQSKADSIPVAFSRRFVVGGGELFYKLIPVAVGVADTSKMKPELKEEFQFLKEVLDEDIG